MQLNSKESGQGRVVILLHGMLGSLDNWHPIARRLAETFHVFTLDQRNHGLSPHSSKMNYPLMAADMDEFMALHRIKSTAVIGHSMGGKTAMQFALKFPHRVEKLVVADMAPRDYKPTYDRIFAALLKLNLPGFQTRQQVEDALATEIPDLDLRRFLLKNLGRDPEGRFVWKINLRGIAGNYTQLNERITDSPPFVKPALFIRGEKSNYVNPEDEPLIRTLFPRSEIQTISGAGHWLHADRPEEFLRLVLNFL